MNLVDELEDGIGNPLFAIETNLEPLRRRVDGEALEIVDSIERSLEKAKQSLKDLSEKMVSSRDDKVETKHQEM